LRPDLEAFKSQLTIGQRIDWGDWVWTGWIGSYVVVELKKNRVVTKSYNDTIMINGVTRQGPWLSEKTYEYTYRTLNHRIKKGLGYTRFATTLGGDKIIVDLTKCKTKRD